jgi:hypothetical protein
MKRPENSGGIISFYELRNGYSAEVYNPDDNSYQDTPQYLVLIWNGNGKEVSQFFVDDIEKIHEIIKAKVELDLQSRNITVLRNSLVNFKECETENKAA